MLRFGENKSYMDSFIGFCIKLQIQLDRLHSSLKWFFVPIERLMICNEHVVSLGINLQSNVS